MKIWMGIVFMLTGTDLSAQYWQQHADYEMHIDFDEAKNHFKGSQLLTYTNNSPHTLNKVYYHLYFNAFQPNSEMDVRSRDLPDPDKRIGDRILHLTDEEIGYQHIHKVSQEGKELNYKITGTLLEVFLEKPLPPGKSTRLSMIFHAQVPLQVRRNGRDNEEGIRFSMTQWYPKLCEFDEDGWHTDPYIGREFYGVWGDFDVFITIDSSYLIGGTGVLMNPEEIGKGYEKEGTKVRRKTGKRLTWHFQAKNVHDFAWAADPDFVHLKTTAENGVILHMIYQPDSITAFTWPALGDFMKQALSIMNAEFGKYPYPQYTYIQGGDGGMEYPMVTLITGRRNLGSLVGVSVHEMNHSWFQGVLAFDESRYYWMDEGFTEYSGDVVMSRLFPAYAKGAFYGAYSGYLSIAGTDKEEPLSTHADWYPLNRSYGIAAYNKGSVFLSQLRYIVGDSVFKKSFLQFFESWKFKHPKPADLKIIVELNAGMELDWYFDQWIYTTHTIDYALRSTIKEGKTVRIEMEREGEIPMPLEIRFKLQDGSSRLVYIPVSLMLGQKDFADKTVSILPAWRWVDIKYSFEITLPSEAIEIEIDPLHWLADTDRENNLIRLTN
ncbi:MAG: M1 family metallopeptidase [Bacteroidia bacterium]